jgi:hypothetical protein
MPSANKSANVNPITILHGKLNDEIKLRSGVIKWKEVPNPYVVRITSRTQKAKIAKIFI